MNVPDSLCTHRGVPHVWMNGACRNCGMDWPVHRIPFSAKDRLMMIEGLYSSLSARHWDALLKTIQEAYDEGKNDQITRGYP